LTGNRDIEDSLDKLDKLTQEESRAASAEQLRMTHTVDGKVTGVDDRMKNVEEKVQDVRGDVQDVGNRVQTVEGRVQDVRGDVHDVGDKDQDVDDRVQDIGKHIYNRVQGVDDKLDQANRSSSR